MAQNLRLCHAAPRNLPGLGPESGIVRNCQAVILTANVVVLLNVMCATRKVVSAATATVIIVVGVIVALALLLYL